MFLIRKKVFSYTQNLCSFYFHHNSQSCSIVHNNTYLTGIERTYSTLRTLHVRKKKELLSLTENDRGESLNFKIIDPKSSKFTQMLISAKSKKTRYSKHLILVEGKRLIIEALKAKTEPVMICFSRRNLIEGLPLDCSYATPDKTVLHQIPYKDLRYWSDLTTSPGIFGIFKMPNLEKIKPPVDKLPITLICDNIREPGNLGSILRIAAGIPAEKVVLVTGCTDLWDSKVIRSSSGAMFYLNIMNNASWDDVNDVCQGKVLLADHLPSHKSREMVANSEDIFEESDIPYDDYDDIEKNETLRDNFKLPIKSCFDINVDSNESYFVVIGGETHGLSENAFQLAESKNGCRINIPLSECVDSLNTGAALAIISFELKRQLMSKDTIFCAKKC